MPTGYQNEFGVDLEDLFEPGSVPALGYLLADDTTLRFAARGSAQKGPDIGYQDVNGLDLSNLWLPKGSAPPALGFNGKSYGASAQAPSLSVVQATARLTLQLRNNGTWEIVRTVSGAVSGNGTAVLESGVWLPSGGVVSDYEVQFTPTASGQGSTTNSAPSYTALSVSQTISLIVSVDPATADNAIGSSSMVCLLRRAGQTASGSTCSFSCSATGYL